MSSRYAGRLPRTYAQAEKMLGNRERRTLINNTCLLYTSPSPRDRG